MELHKKQPEQPHMPPPLLWGASAAINTVSGPTLDSLVIHACVFREKGQIREILIVGQSLPEIQQEILQAVLACALRVKAGDLDMINVGAYRIVAPGDDLVPGTGGIEQMTALIQPDARSGAEALGDIVRRLRLIQQRTELVAVYEVELATREEFDSALRSYAREVFRENDVIIVAKNPTKTPGLVNAVSIVPYYQIARRPSPLEITLPADLLEARDFLHLLEAFTYQTVERICADAQVRQEMYAAHAHDYREEQKRWYNTSERDRKTLWNETVLLSMRFDPDTASSIRLLHPKEIPTTTFMEEHLPQLIEGYEQWAERMGQIVRDIRTAAERPDMPVRRLAASCFLDAALRDRGHLIADATLRPLFERWSVKIAPYLRAKWHTALAERGISADVVFNRHSVFHTWFQTNDSYRITNLIMQPLAVVSPAHTVLRFDPAQQIMEVYTPNDFAETRAALSRADADKRCQEFERWMLRSGVNQSDLITRLRTLLAEAPAALLPRIVAVLVPSATTDDLWKPERLHHEKTGLDAHVRLAMLLTTLGVLRSYGAFHTARQLIRETQVPQDLKARITLWQVLLECRAHNQDPKTFIPILIGENWFELADADGAEEIISLLHAARQHNAAFVAEWVHLLVESEDIRPALDWLRRDWVRLDAYLTSSQRQALYLALSAVETVNLAQALERAAKTIQMDAESTATVLAQIGEELAGLVMAEIGAIPDSDVSALLEKLLGQEHSYY